MSELIKGGWVMIPLAICSIAAVAVIIERFLFFRHLGKTELAEKILRLLQEQRQAEAIALAEKSSLPLIKIMSAGMNNPAAPAKAMAAASIKELSVLKRGLPVLDTIVTLSPLLGLLGTIVGMINSFQVMAISGTTQPHAVTGGVAEALIATASGITIAVVALVPHNYFASRIEKETEVIEYYATRLEMVLNPEAKEQQDENIA